MGIVIRQLIVLNGLTLKDIYVNINQLKLIKEGAGFWSASCSFNFYSNIKKSNDAFYTERCMFMLGENEMGDPVTNCFIKLCESKGYNKTERY